MNIDRQVEIMRKQLEAFDGLMEKAQYLARFFDPDPQFSQEARSIIRADLCKLSP